MNRARIAAVALLAASATALAGAAWERKVEFARGLAARSCRDIAESTLDALAADPAIPAAERPALFLALADCWFDLAAAQSGGTAGVQGALHCLGKAGDSLAELRAVAGAPAPRVFEAAMRSAWLARQVAALHARLAGDKALPDLERRQHRQEAVRGYEAAAQEFAALAARQQDRALVFRVRLAANQVRVELATFLKEAKAPEAEWKPPADAAAKDCHQMLFDFRTPRAAAETTLPFAEALLLLGNAGEALDRLDEVWQARAEFADCKALPCKARYLAALAFFRRGEPQAAINALDEMLVFRTRGGRAYDPKAIRTADIKAVLEGLEDDVPAQFGQRDVAQALLLAAEACAALGDRAKGARMPEEVRDLFAKAYHLGLGVCEADVPLDPKWPPLLERWRREAGLPPSATLLRRLGERAFLEKKYGDAARLFTQSVAGEEEPKPEALRKTWEWIAGAYYRNEEYYRAATVFRALSRWFPRPAAKALDYASWAHGAMKQQAELTGDPADHALADEFGREAERLGPQGPGTLHLKRAAEERKAGRPERALALLQEIRPSSPAYPGALCESVLAHKAIFEGLPGADQAGPKGQEALAAMGAEVRKLFDRAKASPAGERRYALDNLALALAAACEPLLKENVKEPAKALVLAANVEQACPGIADSPAFPRVPYARLRAASLLLPGSSDEQCRTLVASIEGDWKALAAFPDFAALPNACGLTASALDHLAKRLGDPAQAAAARDRGLECWLQLLRLAPRQPIGTYRFALARFLNRAHEPKSADYRRIADLGAKAIELQRGTGDPFGHLGRLEVSLGESYNRSGEHRPAIDLLFVEATTAVARCRLGGYREAALLLEEVQRVAEAVYQNRLALAEREGGRTRPARETLHLQVRRWLARCTLELAAHSKYGAARTMLLDDLPLYPRDKPEHWDTLYWLCETLRREGRHEDALKLIRRAALDTTGAMGTGVVKDAKGTPDDFRRLVLQIQQDARRLDDPARRAALLSSAAEALRQLGN